MEDGQLAAVFGDNGILFGPAAGAGRRPVVV
jgi:hypothetical protein